jgi:hypothetical protein
MGACEVLVSCELLTKAEARVAEAERACAIREEILRDICGYLDREQHRAYQAARALRDSPELVEREKASARAHEMSTVADVIKRTAYMVTYPKWVAKWLHPRDAEKVHRLFSECFERLQDQQAMTDDVNFDEYRAAIALVAPKSEG